MNDKRCAFDRTRFCTELCVAFVINKEHDEVICSRIGDIININPEDLND